MIAQTHAIEDWCPSLSISERDGRVRLGLEGFASVEGTTLQEAGDELVAQLLQVAMAVRAGGGLPLGPDLRPDPALVRFVWELCELVAAGGDPRDLLFGPNPLAA